KGEVSNLEDLFYQNRMTLNSEIKKLFLETEVDKIDIQNKKISCVKKDGTRFSQEYDKVILATGSKQIMLDIPGNNLANIFSIKNFPNAKEIFKALDDSTIKKVGIIGAGYIGVEIAEAIRKRGKEVYLFDVADRVLSTYYDRSFSDKVEEILSKNGIHLCLSESPKKYLGRKKIEKIVTTSGTQYSMDMVVQAIGFLSNSPIGEKELLRDVSGAYLTNEYQQTNIKDIYAIGDCATTFFTSINRSSVDFSISNALRTAYIATQHINNQDFTPSGSQFTNGFSIFNYNFYAAGLNLKTARLLSESIDYIEIEDFIRPAFLRKNSRVKLRISFEKNTKRIVGVQLCSQEDLSGLLSMFSLAIEEQITLDKLKMLDYLFHPSFSQPYNFILKAVTGLNIET
ncbi:TPA: FAD-dependent oxidoreductase, partial [Enterococcus faecium]|nr:FAD-dependent oxidoreductase [Enterococcus faecium]HCC1501927.1 FAD-dependent oxidoreductase [Enterococcus faecium]HEG3514271.1 FAD-dependent oxidoreductase [Enterococcus faecium]HEG4325659.1 FAD-dependent oxidoreductase [Enterococcus faecium]